jgi:hypothetical protein
MELLRCLGEFVVFVELPVVTTYTKRISFQATLDDYLAGLLAGRVVGPVLPVLRGLGETHPA